MPLPSEPVQVTLIRPGGTATREFADGAATMRLCAGFIHDPDDGLMPEMNAGREPTPWASRQIRDDAASEIGARSDLAEDVRQRLANWVLSSPYYADT